MRSQASLPSDTDFRLIERGLRAFPPRAPIPLDFTGRPLVAALGFVSSVMMTALGPAYSTALFFYAELST